MTTAIVGSPEALESLLAPRRALGQDARDEVWEGVYHVAPHEHRRNGIVASRLTVLLDRAARQAGLAAGGSFNLGSPADFRVPGLGFHDRNQSPELFYDTAPLVIEFLSPNDETYAKFAFYALHQVAEIWVVDPLTRSIAVWHWAGEGSGHYDPSTASSLLGLTCAELESAIDWP